MPQLCPFQLKILLLQQPQRRSISKTGKHVKVAAAM
jgi:hypothetical protein